MGISKCAAAMAAAAFAVSGVASAGIVYDSASRVVSIAVNGNVVASDSTSALGEWVGSRFWFNPSYTAVATQGSNLTSTEMTFTGGSQINSNTAVWSVGSISVASVFFRVDANEIFNWFVGLNTGVGGSGNQSSAAFLLVDTSTGSNLVDFSGTASQSGTVELLEGRVYQVAVSGLSQTSASGNAFTNLNAGLTSIPAPGAAALLGLAALTGATGRRRR